MINSAHARDNGAYAQYQQKQTQHTYVPDHWDPSDGETTAVEVGVYALIIVLFLGVVLWTAIKKDKKHD